MTDIKDIKAFCFDVDGVFTNGGVLCDLHGELYRTYDAKDGFALRMASMNGYHLGIITGGRSKSIVARFLTSGINEADIYLGSRNKEEELMDFCKAHDLKPSDVLFIGDDLPDLTIFNVCGVSACPSDAVNEVIEAADIVSSRPGGHGCIREILEMVMKAQGKWSFDVGLYKKLF